MPRSDVEIEKIDNRSEADAVDYVADRAANDEADRDRQEWAVDTAQPINQHRDDRGGNQREKQHVEPGPAVEEAEAHAAVAGENEVQKGGDRLSMRQRAISGSKVSEDGGLAKLIENRNDDRRGKTANEHQSPLAAMAVSLRLPTTAAQRQQRSARSGVLPTSGSTLQQR